MKSMELWRKSNRFFEIRFGLERECALMGQDQFKCEEILCKCQHRNAIKQFYIDIYNLLSNIGLYYDENEFHTPEKLVIKLCLV